MVDAITVTNGSAKRPEIGDVALAVREWAEKRPSTSAAGIFVISFSPASIRPSQMGSDSNVSPVTPGNVYIIRLCQEIRLLRRHGACSQDAKFALKVFHIYVRAAHVPMSVKGVAPMQSAPIVKK